MIFGQEKNHIMKVYHRKTSTALLYHTNKEKCVNHKNHAMENHVWRGMTVYILIFFVHVDYVWLEYV